MGCAKRLAEMVVDSIAEGMQQLFDNGWGIQAMVLVRIACFTNELADIEPTAQVDGLMFNELGVVLTGSLDAVAFGMYLRRVVLPCLDLYGKEEMGNGWDLLIAMKEVILLEVEVLREQTKGWLEANVSALCSTPSLPFVTP